jgi:putative GTP pyrophosphokinase
MDALENICDLMNDETVKELISGFIDMQQLYNAAIKEVRTKLEILDDEFSFKNNRNPIHSIESRLKSVASLLTKMSSKNMELTVENMRDKIFDIAGIRVICSYVEDIYIIERLLLSQTDVRLLRRKDYIEHPKANGYRSLHIVVSVPIFLSDKVENMPVEVQIRTIAMDFWASLEHHMRYKAKREELPEGIEDELLECSKTIADLDYKMQGIYKRLK